MPGDLGRVAGVCRLGSTLGPAGTGVLVGEDEPGLRDLHALRPDRDVLGRALEAELQRGEVGGRADAERGAARGAGNGRLEPGIDLQAHLRGLAGAAGLLLCSALVRDARIQGIDRDRRTEGEALQGAPHVDEEVGLVGLPRGGTTFDSAHEGLHRQPLAKIPGVGGGAGHGPRLGVDVETLHREAEHLIVGVPESRLGREADRVVRESEVEGPQRESLDEFTVVAEHLVAVALDLESDLALSCLAVEVEATRAVGNEGVPLAVVAEGDVGDLNGDVVE